MTLQPKSRRWNLTAIVTIAVVAALTTLTTDVGAKQAPEATAPREAGEPIMAIVSIKSQRVTFYDADGWIVSAPVSTGTKGRETPAGVFAVLEKDLDHHSTPLRRCLDAPHATAHLERHCVSWWPASGICRLARLCAHAVRLC